MEGKFVVFLTSNLIRQFEAMGPEAGDVKGRQR